jgi:glutamyl/glutaminyl-tRNA synthetase
MLKSKSPVRNQPKTTTKSSKLLHAQHRKSHNTKRNPLTTISTQTRQLPKSTSKPALLRKTQQSSYQTQLIDEKAPLNTTSGPVRVRFAPSPTGTLHLGGLRTALYNALFVKNRGGELILRIEDTDRTRLVPGAVESLINDMKWVNITYDEGPDGVHKRPYQDDNIIEKSNSTAVPRDASPYTQSERSHLYQQAAQRLLDNGHAYECFCTPERLDQVRQTRAAKGEPIIYDRLCLTLTPDEIIAKKNNSESFVVRMKMPDGITTTKDLVRGEVKFQNNLIDDQVLVKSDGFPTYHLANIVDDHMMAITHVIRGEEWLPSLPKHVTLYKMFGWEAPQFAHLPLLLREDGGKLSKRFRDSSLNYYVEMGYLPESIINFVSLLGWHPTLDELQERADNKSGKKMTTDPTITTTTTTTTTKTNPKQQDVTKIDPNLLKALLTDDKTKLKQKTNQLAQSTSEGGGVSEVFTVDELSQYFDINNIQKSGATVELSKLKFFHTQHWKRAINQDISRLAAFSSPHVHDFISRFKSNSLNEHDLKCLDGVEFYPDLSIDPTIQIDPSRGINTKYHHAAMNSTLNGIGNEYQPNQSIITALKTTRDHPCTLIEFAPKSIFTWARPKLHTPNALTLKQSFWINTENKTTQAMTTSDLLTQLVNVIQTIPDSTIQDYDVSAIVTRFKSFSKTNKVSLKEIYQPLRFAFTGSLAGPGVADQLCAIGKDEAINRIKLSLE